MTFMVISLLVINAIWLIQCQSFDIEPTLFKPMCSDKLIEAMRHNCQRTVIRKAIELRLQQNQNSRNKRSIHFNHNVRYLNNVVNDLYGDSNDDGFDLNSRLVDLQDLQSKRAAGHKKTLTLTQECCEKSCDLITLVEYCPTYVAVLKDFVKDHRKNIQY